MRNLVGFVFVMALAALPPSASAQATDEAAPSKPNLREPMPSPEPASEEPAEEYRLSLWEWHEEALTIALFSRSPTFDGYGSEQYSSDPYEPERKAMELRVKRAKIGLGVSSASFGVGFGLALGGLASDSVAAFVIGEILSIGGVAGMIASGILLRRRKRDLREAHYGAPHRVQWDLAQSRLVF